MPDPDEWIIGEASGLILADLAALNTRVVEGCFLPFSIPRKVSEPSAACRSHIARKCVVNWYGSLFPYDKAGAVRYTVCRTLLFAQ